MLLVFSSRELIVVEKCRHAVCCLSCCIVSSVLRLTAPIDNAGYVAKVFCYATFYMPFVTDARLSEHLKGNNPPRQPHNNHFTESFKVFVDGKLESMKHELKTEILGLSCHVSCLVMYLVMYIVLSVLYYTSASNLYLFLLK